MESGSNSPSPVRPKLKDVVWERIGDELRTAYDMRDQLVLADPDGTVEVLLGLLREGGRTTVELADVMTGVCNTQITEHEVDLALGAFDEHGLLEDGERLGTLNAAEAERYFSNLAFFESFATLARSREDLQHDLSRAHVLVLGTGGLNSNTIPHLCGLGVGHLTLIDRDVVEPRNFARQYLYQWADLGADKVERAAAWVRAFDPNITVTHTRTEITSTDVVQDLLDIARPDVVMSGVDSPPDVDLWVNEACVTACVPYVRAGIFITQGVVWSVDPGRSACRACKGKVTDSQDSDPTGSAAGIALLGAKQQANRGIGPVAGLLGSLSAFEVLRYLTAFEPPAYAGAPLIIDFARGCATEQVVWDRAPDCPVCAAGTKPAKD